MATEPTSLSRQPTKLDYASPTQFRFLINQLPKVEYFTTEANIPGITLAEGTYATPLKDIPILGDKLTYEDLTITFIVDENLENYIEMHTWLTGIGFPSHDLAISGVVAFTSPISLLVPFVLVDMFDVVLLKSLN